MASYTKPTRRQCIGGWSQVSVILSRGNSLDSLLTLHKWHFILLNTLHSNKLLSKLVKQIEKQCTNKLVTQFDE